MPGGPLVGELPRVTPKQIPERKNIGRKATVSQRNASRVGHGGHSGSPQLRNSRAGTTAAVDVRVPSSQVQERLRRLRTYSRGLIEYKHSSVNPFH